MRPGFLAHVLPFINIYFLSAQVCRIERLRHRFLSFEILYAHEQLVSHNVRARIFGHESQAKNQISLRIRAVWSESSLDSFGIGTEA